MKGLILVLLGITTLSSTTYGKHVMLKRQIEEPSLQAVVETLSATVERLQAQVLALQDKLGKLHEIPQVPQDANPFELNLAFPFLKFLLIYHFNLSLSPSLTHTLSLSLTYTQSLSHTHTHPLSLSPSLSLTHTLPLSPPPLSFKSPVCIFLFTFHFLSI